MYVHTHTVVYVHLPFLLQLEVREMTRRKIPISFGEPNPGLLRRNYSPLMLSPSQLGIASSDMRALCPVKVVDALPCSFPWVILLPKGNPVAWFPVTEIIKPRIYNYLSQLLLLFSRSATSSKCRLQCSI